MCILGQTRCLGCFERSSFTYVVHLHFFFLSFFFWSCSALISVSVSIQQISQTLIVLRHFKAAPISLRAVAEQNVVTFPMVPQWDCHQRVTKTFTVFRRCLMGMTTGCWISGLLQIKEHFTLTLHKSLTEGGGLIMLAADRSPMRRIDHQLVTYWPSECWQLTTTDC